MFCRSTFGARTKHEQTKTYKIHQIHHDPDLGEVATFPLILLYVFSHEACTQMSFCPETPKLKVLKFSKLGLLQLWKPITLFTDLRLR
jgi:hypothetical protein